MNSDDTVVIQIRLPRWLHSAIKADAKIRRQSMHSLVVDRLSRTYTRKAYADRKKAKDDGNT